ncbi:MAG TPA: LLM class flavin-dependent oxidoreductase [Candidatus Binataceae bacterium]|nr:LLM class flavin-dependent oxidoreductase [Candidatus Binataceae bacterium]
MKISFGIHLAPGPFVGRDDLSRVGDLVKMAEDYGAEAIGTYDSAFIGDDAYVRATLLATASTRARVGLRPTNPLTREPQVMASFLASIDSLTGGRAFMDIASGDSAVLNIGFKIASRARIEDYVNCVRGLLATGEATYRNRPQRVRWSSRVLRHRIPISLCAEGPKMLHLGGRIFDGVIAGTGLLPEVIADTTTRIQAGAREAGRSPSDVEVWFTTRTSLNEDNDQAIEHVKASVSSILNHSMRQGLDGKLVPDELRAKIQTYVDGYVLYEHVLSSGTNPRRMEELGLTGYALKRFALAGNPEAWIARIEEIAAAGAIRLWLNAEGGNLDRQLHYMRLLGERVMSRFTK